MENESTKIHLAAITGGEDVPSRRFRIHALKEYLSKRSVSITEYLPCISSYPPKNKLARPFWGAAAVAERLTYVGRIRGYDATILQRELISTYPTLEPWLQGPRILDVDDAIYLNRRGRAAKKISRDAIGVVCGNSHLAERFSKWNKNVSVIPTGVDTRLLKPLDVSERSDGSVVGWIGTSGNMRYLEDVAEPIRSALLASPGSKLHVISDSFDNIPTILKPLTVFTRWYPGVECLVLPYWDVGVMPLGDGEWERGKCSFKALQYMAAGLSVVVSPVGMNAELLNQGDIGYGPKSREEWSEALVTLLRNRSYCRFLGQNGRLLAENCYSLDSVSDRWVAVLSDWLG